MGDETYRYRSGMTTRLTRMYRACDKHARPIRTSDVLGEMKPKDMTRVHSSHDSRGGRLYGSFFFPFFSIFIMRREYLYCHTWKHVCNVNVCICTIRARTDPLCRETERSGYQTRSKSIMMIAMLHTDTS